MGALEDLVGWHAVHDLSLRYAEAIDTRNWPALRSVFADPVTVDFSSFTHRPAPEQPLRADDWVAAVRATIDGFTSTQHLIGNHRIVITGDTGRYSAYVQAQHWMATDRWYLVGGWYETTVRREGGEWRLSGVTMHQTWDAGDRSLLGEATRRVKQGTGS